MTIKKNDDFVEASLAVFQRLMEEATDRRRKRSLEALNEVCQLLNERNSSEFSIRSIVNLGKDRGLPVPSEKSIVNSTGLHYRELIHAWTLSSVVADSTRAAGHTDWIECIADPVLRMSVTLMAKELRALKAKEARQSQRGGEPIYLGGSPASNVAGPPGLSDIEIAALKSAIDPSALRLVGLSIGDRGEIVDSKARRVHKPGFSNAIEKILSLPMR